MAFNRKYVPVITNIIVKASNILCASLYTVINWIIKLLSISVNSLTYIDKNLTLSFLTNFLMYFYGCCTFTTINYLLCQWMPEYKKTPVPSVYRCFIVINYYCRYTISFPIPEIFPSTIG